VLAEFHKGVLAGRTAVIQKYNQDIDLAIQRGLFETTRKCKVTGIYRIIKFKAFSLQAKTNN
jgi:hypothetical protein